MPAVTNIKYAALDTFARYVKTEIGLESKVFFSEEAEVKYPSLAVVSRAFTFMPWQAVERNLPYTDPDYSATDSLYEVGGFEGELELRLYARSAPEREDWTQRLVNLFMKDEGRPGIVILFTPDVVIEDRNTLFAAPCSFILEDEEWRDEAVFTDKRYTYATIQAAFPALISKPAANIETLYLAWSDNLAATVGDVEYLIDPVTGLVPNPPPPYTGPPLPELPAGQAWQWRYYEQGDYHYIANIGAGAVPIYQWDGSTWSLTGPLTGVGNSMGSTTENTYYGRMVDFSPDGVASFGDYLYTSVIRDASNAAWSGGLLPASQYAFDNHGNPGDPTFGTSLKYPNVYV
jgi:hypothetical protein